MGLHVLTYIYVHIAVVGGRVRKRCGAEEMLVVEYLSRYLCTYGRKLSQTTVKSFFFRIYLQLLTTAAAASSFCNTVFLCLCVCGLFVKHKKPASYNYRRFR